MNRTPSKLIRIFVTGVLAALPLAATVAIFWWAGTVLNGYFGPNSRIGGVLVRIGLGVSGSELVGYLIGIGVVGVALFGLGVLVENGLQRGLQRLVEAVVQRIPVVRTVYDMSRKMVDMLSQRGDGSGSGARSMRPVWCHFGGPGGVAVLGLLSTPQPVELNGQRYHAVLVPTAPVPVGGGLLYVPEAWVTPAEVGIDGLTSIYVSMGVTSLDHLPRAAAAAPAPQPGA